MQSRQLLWGCMAAYSLSFLVFGMQCGMLGPTASTLARQVSVQEADLGVIFTINGLSSIIGGLPSGWLCDNLPGHAVLATALAVEAVGFALIPLCSSMVALAAAFASVSLSWNIINSANTYVLWISNNAAAQQQGSSGGGGGGGFFINLVNAAFGAGSLAAPLVADACGRLLAGGAGAAAAYWVTAGITAASAAAFLLLPSPKPPSSSVSSGGTAAAAAAAGSGDADGLQQPLLASSDAAEQRAAAAAVAPAAADSWWSGGGLSLLLLIVGVFNFLSVGTEIAFGGWIYTYAVLEEGLSAHAGRVLNAVYWGSFTAGRVAASFAAEALPPAALLYGSLPLALLGAALPLAAPPSGWLLLASCVLLGLGVSAAFANSLALLDSYEPCTGSVTGLLGGVAGAGCMTVPLLIAQLAKHTSMQALMWCSLGSFGAQLACVPLCMAVGRCVTRRRMQREKSVTGGLLGADAGEALAPPPPPGDAA